MCSAKLMALKKSGRQDVPCTPVCAAHSGLLDAKLGSVHPFVHPSLASWAPFCPVLSALAALSEPIWAPRCPSELQVGFCTANMSSNLPCSCPSRALLTCKIINFHLETHGFCRVALFAVELHLDCCFVALGPLLDVFGAQLGASWAPLGASWTPLGPPNWPPSATWAPLGPPN